MSKGRSLLVEKAEEERRRRKGGGGNAEWELLRWLRDEGAGTNTGRRR